MVKVKNCIILLCFLFLLSGCSSYPVANPQKTTATKAQKTSSEIKTVPFVYFFRGFITLTQEQLQSYPQGTYVIENEDDWDDFMGHYVAGVRYDVSVDYSRESLVVDVTFPALPSYSTGTDIRTFKEQENKFVPEYITYETTGISNRIYAQNANGVEHCYLNIVKMDKADIPKDIKNVYRKGDVINN